MGKMKGYTLILASAVLLSGCVKNDIKMTDEQVDRAAEYVSGVLLKYDKNYESTLIAETLAPEESTEPVENDDNESTDTENAGQDVSDTEIGNEEENVQEEPLNKATLSDVMGTKGCKVSFLQYEVSDGLEQEGIAYMKPEKDKKLLVLEFKIKNNSNSDQKVKLLTKNISYTLTVNDGIKYKPELTILTNDLQFYNESIPKGKSKKAVLVFSVSQEEADQSMTLLVTRGKQNSEINIK